MPSVDINIVGAPCVPFASTAFCNPSTGCIFLTFFLKKTKNKCEVIVPPFCSRSKDLLLEEEGGILQDMLQLGYLIRTNKYFY